MKTDSAYLRDPLVADDRSGRLNSSRGDNRWLDGERDNGPTDPLYATFALAESWRWRWACQVL
jgi:hypothetical protein